MPFSPLDVVWVFAWSRGSHLETMRGDTEDDSKKYRKNLSPWCHHGAVELTGPGMALPLAVLLGEMIDPEENINCVSKSGKMYVNDN